MGHPSSPALFLSVCGIRGHWSGDAWALSAVGSPHTAPASTAVTVGMKEGTSLLVPGYEPVVHECV